MRLTGFERAALDTVVLLVGVVIGEVLTGLSSSYMLVALVGVYVLIAVGFASLRTKKLRWLASISLGYATAVTTFILQGGYDVLLKTWNLGGDTVFVILLISAGPVFFFANLLRSESRS